MKAQNDKIRRLSLSPSDQLLPNFYSPLGYALRMLCIFLLIFALTWFAFDSVWINIPIYRIFIIALLSSAPMLLMSVSRRAFVVVSIITLSALIIAAHLIEHPIMLVMDSFQYVKDTITSIFSYNVFNSFDESRAQSAFTVTFLLDTAVYCFSFVLAALIVPFTAKRVRLSFLSFIILAVMSPAFIFNLCRSGLPFSAIIAIFIGFAVLWRYERAFFKGKELSVRERAVGGFTVFTVSLLAAALIALPAVYTKKPWWTMEYVYDRVTEIRASLASGMENDNGSAGGLFADGSGTMESIGRRNASASPRLFTGQLILRVKAYSPRPIYLRSWIGIDYADNCWSCEGPSKYEEYTEKFGSGFMPESLTVGCLRSLANIRDNSALFGGAHTFDGFGFISTPVDVEVITSAGYLMYIPTLFDSDIGLLSKGGGPDEPYEEGYGGYFEGVTITGRYNFYKTYRALAYLPNYDDFFANCDALSERYPAIDPDGCSKALAYSDFVASAYLSTADDDILSEYIDEYLSDAVIKSGDGSYKPRDSSPSAISETVIAVIDSLADNCRYTLTPSSSDSSDAIEAFLFGAREGYCVQFATASALLLRKIGIPTRYAEGYIASKLVKSKNSDIYSCDVKDEAAHAWIEVYIKPFGWLQYETTPEYYADAYRPAAVSVSESTAFSSSTELDNVVSENEANDEISSDADNFTQTAQRVSISLSAILTAAGIGFAVFVIVRSVFKKLRLAKIINRAYEAESDGERRRILRLLHAQSRALLKRRGFTEGSSEHISEFSARLDRASDDGAFSGLPCTHSEAFELFRAAEFGRVPDKASTIKAAEYTESLAKGKSRSKMFKHNENNPN